MMQAIPTVSPVFDPARGREALTALRRRWRPRAADDAALRGLDAATLRDLGLSRSELESVACEAEGAVEPTRRRIARRPDAAPRDGPRSRGSAPRRPWVHSAWPVGLLIAAAAASVQPALYLQVHTRYAYRPMFPGLTIGGGFPANIDKTAWMRLL